MESITRYKAQDGKEFATVELAEAHEEKLRERAARYEKDRLERAEQQKKFEAEVDDAISGIPAGLRPVFREFGLLMGREDGWNDGMCRLYDVVNHFEQPLKEFCMEHKIKD